MESVLVYGGFVAIGLGLLCVARPLRLLGLRSRRAGAALAAAGLALAAGAMALPAPLRRPEGRPTRLDDFVPAYQFSEVHQTRVHATPSRVFGAIRSVTAGEIRLFRTLTWIRSPRLPWRRPPETILSAPADRPILDVALGSGFLLLADDADRELVLGTVVCCEPVEIADAGEFAALARPGFAKAALNFLVEDEGGGWCRLTTQTRVLATDDSARRRFAAYWRLIYPGSAIIRRMWLAAIKARAESA